MNTVLDNIIWNTLTGPHARFASGSADARRYASGFSPIVGFAQPERPDFASLAPFCEAGERFYCAGWSGEAPDGWRLDTESTMFLMLWNGELAIVDGAPHAVALGPEHASRALELAELTHPGPFGPRTIELGEYFGIFDGDRLVAMAGERMHAGAFREISGVCTHPEFQGHGLARQLMSKLIYRQTQRGETPFLHVMRDNAHARRFYERMEFRNYHETIVRVIGPC